MVELKVRHVKKYLLSLIFNCIFFNVNAQTVHFTNVSEQAGIHHQFKPYQGTFGGGATIFDFNNDGYDDIFLAGGTGDDKLYINNRNGTFTDIYKTSGLKTKTKYITQGAVTADVNKDGWVDIFITTITTDMPGNLVPRAENLLFLNNGNNTFKNATKDYGLDKFQTFSTGATFGDVNNDGYPDLFVGHYFKEYKGELNIMNDAMIVGSGQMASSQLLINKGGKYFADETEDYGIKFTGFCFGGMFTDFDNDGDLDLIVFNDFGYKSTPNRLYENLYPKDQFKEISKETNMKLPINGMGVAAGDYNNDGWMDYFFTNIRTNQFMVNGGSKKVFENVSLKIGTKYSFSSDSLGRYIPISWGCNFGDFDNDGDLDLFVSCGSLNPSAEPNPDFYFENNNGHFENKALEVGLLNRGIGRGSVIFDYDHDGDLDLLVVSQKPVSDASQIDEPTMLFRNDSPKGNWLEVSLKGLSADTRGLGARVMIVAGNQRMMREIDGGSSHESQSSSIAHFGLGNIKKIDSVIVTWVGGKKQFILHQPLNTILRITEAKAPTKWKIIIGVFAIVAIFIIFFYWKNVKRSIRKNG